MLGDYEGEHRQRTGASTQVAFPWRATMRTIVQVGLPLVLGLGLVVPEVVEIVLEEGGDLPDGFRSFLLSAAFFFTALSAILARVMAIPAVNQALSKVGLSASPLTQPPPRDGERGAFDTGLLVGAAALVIIICGIVWLIQTL